MTHFIPDGQFPSSSRGPKNTLFKLFGLLGLMGFLDEDEDEEDSQIPDQETNNYYEDDEWDYSEPPEDENG